MNSKGNLACAESSGAAPTAGLVDVLPVFVLEEISQQGEHGQKEQDPDADGCSLEYGRFAGILQEVRDISRNFIKLLRTQASCLMNFEMLELRLMVTGGWLELRCLYALQFP